MPELPIRPEALDVAAKAFTQDYGTHHDHTRAAIAAFCEAEKLTVQFLPVCRMGAPKHEENVRWGDEYDTCATSAEAISSLSSGYEVVGAEQRIVGPWRDMEEEQ